MFASAPPTLDATRSPPATRSRARWEESVTKSNDRYCTHQCLLGLRNGGSFDRSCPNILRHRTMSRQHVDLKTFMKLIRRQVHDSSQVIVQGQNISGHVAAFYKVVLLSYGYVLAAKGVQDWDFDLLKNERLVYNHLADIQGQQIPVHLGSMTLTTPMSDQLIDGAHYQVKHLMLMSFGGVRLSDLDQTKLGFKDVHAEVESIMALLAARGLRQRNPYPRNVLYANGQLMIIDFDRATICQ